MSDAVEARVPEEPVQPGSVLLGRYRVLDTIARGATGTVYQAEHVDVGRKLAIKVLLAERSARAAIARRFRLEARKVGSLGHPHVALVLDDGVLPDGRLFLVMEYLEGRSLGDELEEVLVFEAERACLLARQVALALGAGHREGIVHRDIKPSNIMLVDGPDGEVAKVLDFGVAGNIAVGVGSAEDLTDVCALTGTAGYMAPEQGTSAAPGPAVDVYAVGVILYEMLTGSLPFTAMHTFELLTLKLNRPAPAVDLRRPGLPPPLVRLVADCLDIDPARRPADGDALAARLDAIFAGLGPGPPRPADEIAERVDPAGRGEDRGARPLAPPEGPGQRPASVAPDPADAPASGPRSRRLVPVAGVALALGGAAALLLVTRGPREAEPLALQVSPDEVEVPPLVVSPPPGPEPGPAPLPAPASEPAPARPRATRAAGKPLEPAAAEPLPALAPVDAPRAGDEPLPAPVDAPAQGPAHRSARCQRVRLRADEARWAQRWSMLRDLSRQHECWAAPDEARKLQTKAAMELGDFSACMAAGEGLDDQEVRAWLKLCEKRSGD